MPVTDKLGLLTAAAQFDVCGCGGMSRSITPSRFIHRTAVPGHGYVCLFKVLQTNICTNDCIYCVNRAARDIPRSSFQSEELAKLFMSMKEKRLVQGLFLSSGIGGNASRTMESMIDTVTILRKHYEFKGYIHLKILPGASLDCVEEACKLASRVSINMEAPTSKHLSRLSHKKHLQEDILERMRWVKQIAEANENRIVPSGQTTQFVVGAAGESDRELLQTVRALYDEIKLRRAYFSAFVPVGNSPSERLRPTPPLREHRLYQSDWLLRVYGFSLPEVELALDKQGNLPLAKDPKLIIAASQPWLFPVDINRASFEELLRVPGIGPISAQRIVEVRREHSINSIEQLKKMRVVVKRATDYIWLPGMPVLGKQASFLPRLEEETAPEMPSLDGVV